VASAELTITASVLRFAMPSFLKALWSFRNSLSTSSSSRIALSIASQLAATNSPSTKISSVQC
jgi:hypothetical protein